jgi:hypothetical protein
MGPSCYGLAQSSLPQWLEAVGTCSAVILALFREQIVGLFRKPKLKATCCVDSPWTTKVRLWVAGPNGPAWEGECYYVRARVENSGGVRAEKVQVYASRLAKLGIGGKFEEVQTFLPLNTRWANYPAGAPAAFLDGISPGMSAFCDIVAVCDPANPKWPSLSATASNATVGVLQLEAETRESLLAFGAYRLTLQISAANAKPTEKTLDFSHSGTWDPNDALMRKIHLGVSLK